MIQTYSNTPIQTFLFDLICLVSFESWLEAFCLACHFHLGNMGDGVKKEEEEAKNDKPKTARDLIWDCFLKVGVL